MNGFTENEKLIMDKISEIHNMYIDLEKTHPSDINEWVNSIHSLQHIIGIRILRREFPETFSSYSEKL